MLVGEKTYEVQFSDASLVIQLHPVTVPLARVTQCPDLFPPFSRCVLFGVIPASLSCLLGQWLCQGRVPSLSTPKALPLGLKFLEGDTNIFLKEWVQLGE